MAGKKEEIGKGIRALLENLDSDPDVKGSVDASNIGITVLNIPLEHIEVNPFQPRAEFNETALKELADSIVIHGIIQPITVRSVDKERYQKAQIEFSNCFF